MFDSMSVMSMNKFWLIIYVKKKDLRIFFKKWIKNLPNWAFNILMSISLMFLGFLIEKYLGVTIKQLSQLDWFILTIVSLIILMNFLILYYYISIQYATALYMTY